jgi:hypothetical protein
MLEKLVRWTWWQSNDGRIGYLFQSHHLNHFPICQEKIVSPNMGAYGPNLVWGGGHSFDLPDRFELCYTVHINNFVRDFIRAFFKNFPMGGGGIFWKVTFPWDNILVGNSHACGRHTSHESLGHSPPENVWNLKPGNAISCILSIRICSKIYANYTCIWN